MRLVDEVDRRRCWKCEWGICKKKRVKECLWVDKRKPGTPKKRKTWQGFGTQSGRTVRLECIDREAGQVYKRYRDTGCDWTIAFTFVKRVTTHYDIILKKLKKTLNKKHSKSRNYRIQWLLFWLDDGWDRLRSKIKLASNHLSDYRNELQVSVSRFVILEFERW